MYPPKNILSRESNHTSFSHFLLSNLKLFLFLLASEISQVHSWLLFRFKINTCIMINYARGTFPSSWWCSDQGVAKNCSSMFIPFIPSEPLSPPSDYRVFLSRLHPETKFYCSDLEPRSNLFFIDFLQRAISHCANIYLKKLQGMWFKHTHTADRKLQLC